MCGLGFIASLNGSPSHDLVDQGLEILKRLAHRGAAGSDPESGDGAGILIQIPHAFFQHELERREIELPLAGDYGVVQVFLSRDRTRASKQMRVLESVVRYHNQIVIGWRDVPVDPRVLGPLAESTRPAMKQLFVGRVAPAPAFERTLFMIRKRAERLCAQLGQDGGDFYIVSCSSKTVVYKGLALPEKLAAFYADLADPAMRTSLAVVHSRFSTNTFPTWDRAHPYRRIAHNGEINTLRGNQTWMEARESLLESRAFAEHIADFKPIIRPGGSDSASLDDVVDFLVASGRPLPHVMMMLVPEAWTTQDDMPEEKRAFYEYHAALVEPWDGPAALVFSDGALVGATLDRNGLRPAKYVVTRSGFVVMASELGVLDFEPEDILEKGRLNPGKMLLVDVDKRRIVTDDEIKHEMASRKPYATWIHDNKIELSSLGNVSALHAPLGGDERAMLERAFGYTREEKRIVLTPMATRGEEATGSMGIDSPLAVLSDEPQLLFRYFKQQFAQVTNPPIDPIREELVMSLTSCVGGEGNLLGETPQQCRMLELPHPILTNEDIARLEGSALPDFRVARVEALFDAPLAGEGLSAGLDELCEAAIAAVSDAEPASVIVISDRGVSRERAAIPSLLACSAVHHALIRAGKRMRCGLVVESGEPREVTDVALLIGFGAGAVNPYLALDLASELGGEGGVKHYVKALKKGLLKILAKMGISTLSSYQGAQIFEAIGISEGVVERYFPGTASRISGIGLEEIARETLMRHAAAFDEDASAREEKSAGVYAWRADGERHAWSPDAVAKLQRAVRVDDASSYDAFARLVNDHESGPIHLRALWDLQSTRDAVSIEEVEPATAIVHRFATGAMSFGSISKEAHENLAIAMNRIGGKSNSGEGGEDAARFLPMESGDSKRSAIKQVASARFGVTAHYLANADELQIKIAQGAKPGEGGQLPGHKVDAVIARVRHATPGVTLISPPPHHDIYSIEDLAQLVFDLKCVNPRARISVKLVSEAGVGTVAAGVVKAHADSVHVAGHDGGTGASPLSSIHRAGGPWELGLAETQQILVKNGLRARVRVQVDGQLKTGRDVAFAALLGAEEFGFATAPLVASGCVLMRKCHLNTCPVGIATQDPELRARFRGTPEHVIRYFFFVAEELRTIMARLGFRTVDEMVGRVEHIAARAPTSKGLGADKARTLDFADVLEAPEGDTLHCTTRHDEERPSALDERIIEDARLSLKYREPTTMRVEVTNADRAFGARLAGEIARLHGAEGLPDGTITIEAYGTAGQSFGAFATRGMLVVLEGDANDYVGKGLSGGTLAALPPRRSRFRACDNVVVGNTVLYGATSGKAFFAGRAGERFAVRNSGAVVVVEGVGDHACEYMTGGTVVVLGTTGRNFGAGMSGGVAYVYDADGALEKRVNAATELERSAIDAADADVVRALVEEHVQHTRSARGAALLSDWTNACRRFVRVMPLEYKRALAASPIIAIESAR